MKIALFFALMLSASYVLADVIAVEPVTTGLQRVTSIRHVAAAGDHLYVGEQIGKVLLVEPDWSVAADAFIDLTDRVQALHFETGLTGLAFHPDFPADPRFFVHYTRNDGASVISRFLLDSGNARVGDPASEMIMLLVPQPNPEHNCNQLEFGPDGMLYIGCGDGGNAIGPLIDPQRLDHLLGKIMRVNVNGLKPEEPYRIPPGNPFLLVPGARPEIWHLGLRNPYRFSFDSGTGDLWIGDVGMLHWEEVNRVSAGVGGQNFGWPILEGTSCWPSGTVCEPPAGLSPPVHEISHAGFCAIVGGDRIRDSQQPTLDGRYLFADFCTGQVFALSEHGGGYTSNRMAAANGYMPTTFGRAPDGSILIGTYGNGSILRISTIDLIFADDFEN